MIFQGLKPTFLSEPNGPAKVRALIRTSLSSRLGFLTLLIIAFSSHLAAAAQQNGQLSQATPAASSPVQASPSPAPQPSPSPKANLTVQPASANDEIVVAAVGDVMLGTAFPEESLLPPNDGADLLAEVTPLLKRGDVVFGNLEGPLVDSGISAKCRGKAEGRCFAFRVPTRYG